MEKIERIKTGIPGLDDLVEGGIPRGYSVVIIGASGTGKTILGSQLLYNKLKAGERGLLVTFETSKEKIRDQWSRFNWDYDGLVKKGLLNVLSFGGDYDIIETTKSMEKTVKDKKISIVLIDSIDMISAHGRYIPGIIKELSMRVKEGIIPSGEALDRAAISTWIRRVEDMNNITPIFTAEADLSGANLSKTGVPEYECDGVILLMSESVGDKEQRSITLKKLRSTKTNGGTYSFEITDEGIKIKR